MGSEFEVICAAIDISQMRDLEMFAKYLESLWTRFDDDSELMKLNRNSGEFVPVSPETRILISEMQNGYELTEGLFNPGILPIMLRNGFTAPKSNFLPEQHFEASYDELWGKIQIAENRVALPLGLTIDAGGIGKGLAADLLADRAMANGAHGIVINAGGEVAIRGESILPTGWSVGIENPFVEDDLISTVLLESGGLATSHLESWKVGSTNHIVDPRTNIAARCEILQATVLCERTVDAEVLAKMCLLLSKEESLARLTDLGAEALLVLSSGETHQTEGWSDFE